MEDHRIIDPYWQRNEDAITETASKYGKYLQSICFKDGLLFFSAAL